MSEMVGVKTINTYPDTRSFSPKRLAEMIGCSPPTVYGLVREYGIPTDEQPYGNNGQVHIRVRVQHFPLLAAAINVEGIRTIRVEDEGTKVTVIGSSRTLVYTKE